MGRVSRRAPSLDLGERDAVSFGQEEEEEKRRKEEKVTKVLT